MAKKPSTKEMMAARNPLARPVVAPVDIYETINIIEPEAQAKPANTKKKPKTSSPKTSPKKSASSKASKSSNTASPKKSAKSPDKSEDIVRPYSTYLRKSQVKAIKFRAVENDVKDQDIVQAAIDEYFARHK